MRYREFGHLDWEVSALGFGAMRLPSTDGAFYSPNVDEPAAIAMIRRAIDGGVNFVDTAFPYHVGNGELVLGKALADGYREQVKLSTKFPAMLLQKADDYDHYLAIQMEKLQVAQIDFYLFHGLNGQRWEDILRLGVLQRAERAMDDGRIARIGFSFHDDVDAFKRIIDGYDNWSMCLIQHNYMDIENQAGTEGLRYAAAKGIAVAIMEPLLGGALANPPEEVQELYRHYPVQRTPAEWALHWLWDQPEVATVLSGMSSMEQVEANLRAAETAEIGTLTAQDQDLIGRVREIIRSRAPLPCTRCGYCMPCEHGVNIPLNFDIYNAGVMYSSVPGARVRYRMLLKEAERAEACAACAECEQKCPQGIAISEEMPKVHKLLEG